MPSFFSDNFKAAASGAIVGWVGGAAARAQGSLPEKNLNFWLAVLAGAIVNGVRSGNLNSTVSYTIGVSLGSLLGTATTIALNSSSQVSTPTPQL